MAQVFGVFMVQRFDRFFSLARPVAALALVATASCRAKPEETWNFGATLRHGGCEFTLAGAAIEDERSEYCAHAIVAVRNTSESSKEWCGFQLQLVNVDSNAILQYENEGADLEPGGYATACLGESVTGGIGVPRTRLKIALTEGGSFYGTGYAVTAPHVDKEREMAPLLQKERDEGFLSTYSAEIAYFDRLNSFKQTQICAKTLQQAY